MIPGQAPVRMDETPMTEMGFEWEFGAWQAWDGKIEPIENEE